MLRYMLIAGPNFMYADIKQKKLFGLAINMYAI